MRRLSIGHTDVSTEHLTACTLHHLYLILLNTILHTQWTSRNNKKRSYVYIYNNDGDEDAGKASIEETDVVPNDAINARMRKLLLSLRKCLINAANRCTCTRIK